MTLVTESSKKHVRVFIASTIKILRIILRLIIKHVFDLKHVKILLTRATNSTFAQVPQVSVKLEIPKHTQIGNVHRQKATGRLTYVVKDVEL